MRHLTDLDQVAYIRFASVYREFDDAQDFIQAISNIVGKRTKRCETRVESIVIEH